MRAGAVAALVFVFLALAVGVYVLVGTASGQSFEFGATVLQKWTVIPITIVLAIILGIWFFRSGGRDRN